MKANPGPLFDYLARWRAAAPTVRDLDPIAQRAVRAGGQAAAMAKRSARIQYSTAGNTVQVSASGPGAAVALSAARRELLGGSAELRSAVAARVRR